MTRLVWAGMNRLESAQARSIADIMQEWAEKPGPRSGWSSVSRVIGQGSGKVKSRRRESGRND